MKEYPLLQATKKQWIVALEIASTLVLISGAAASLIIAIWIPDLMGLGFGVGVVLSFAMTMTAWFAFYNLVRCPACGKRLNRFKNGKRVPAKQAYTQLQAGHGCRHCGWKPQAGA